MAARTAENRASGGQSRQYQSRLPDAAGPGVQAQNKAPLDNLRRFLESFTGPVIFSVESEGRREALGEMLARIKVAPKHMLRLEEATGNGRYLMIGAAEHGFIDSQRNLALICESDLLGERVARRRQDSRRTINPTP
jgi:transcription-repair coupling factor (superfamily II helicase)